MLFNVLIAVAVGKLLPILGAFLVLTSQKNSELASDFIIIQLDVPNS